METVPKVHRFAVIMALREARDEKAAAAREERDSTTALTGVT